MIVSYAKLLYGSGLRIMEAIRLIKLKLALESSDIYKEMRRMLPAG